MVRKIFILHLLLFLYLFNVKIVINAVEDNHDWNYVYSYASLLNNEETASKIADLVVKYAKINKLDVEIVTRKIWKESRFRQYAKSYERFVTTNYVYNKKNTNIIITINKVALAYGYCQINLNMHDVKLYYVLDKKYAKQLHQNPKFKYELIFFREVNIALGSEVLREEMDRFNNNYAFALTAYWSGPNSDNVKLLIRSNICNHYINDILNKQGFEDKMKLYNTNWHFFEKKKSIYSVKFE